MRLAPLAKSVFCCVLLGTACSSGAPSSSATGLKNDTDKTVQSLLEIGSGQRGKKEDAGGKVRFSNQLVLSGAGVDVDVW